MNSLYHRFALVCLVCLSASSLFAQPAPRAARPAPPENVSFTTKDNVRLRGTYYRSSAGREAVPIVMLHDSKESRTIFSNLALALQSPSDPRIQSHAVLTVDLRGHGESTVAVNPHSGQSSELDSSKLKPVDYEDMVRFDMEAVRRFLVERNDAQELNLNKLCLLGTGMGANVALIWSAVDWDTPPLAQRKQGQDVKALILASPSWKQKGLPLVAALKHPDVQKLLSIMLVYGSQDAKAKQSAETVYKNLERYHPEPPVDKIRTMKDLFDYPLPTKLQGSKLLVDPQFKMIANIDNFIKARLVDQPFEWIQRK